MGEDNTSENNFNINYETLFEILRNEKTKGSLTKLQPNFYELIKNYISQLKIMFPVR